MSIHPTTLILSAMAAGAVAAGIALAPNASAEEPTCRTTPDTSVVCQSPGEYEGNFSEPSTPQPQFPFPLV